MLKNVQEAKFARVLQPIAKVALPAAAQGSVSFDAFFTHILMHELMHGLGPHNITVGGNATTVRKEMKELSSAIEKPRPTCLASSRCGSSSTREARRQAGRHDVHHLPGVDVPVDPVRHQRGARPRRGDPVELLPRPRRRQRERDGTFQVNADAFKQNVVDLTRDIMTMQAVGDYAAAKAMIEKLGVIRPPTQAILDKLKDVPVDIEPRYVTAQQLEASNAR
jgi:hypothetical protein